MALKPWMSSRYQAYLEFHTNVSPVHSLAVILQLRSVRNPFFVLASHFLKVLDMFSKFLAAFVLRHIIRKVIHFREKTEPFIRKFSRLIHKSLIQIAVFYTVSLPMQSSTPVELLVNAGKCFVKRTEENIGVNRLILVRFKVFTHPVCKYQPNSVVRYPFWRCLCATKFVGHTRKEIRA